MEVVASLPEGRTAAAQCSCSDCCVQAKLGHCERKLEKNFIMWNCITGIVEIIDHADVQGMTPVGRPSCRWEGSVKYNVRVQNGCIWWALAGSNGGNLLPG